MSFELREHVREWAVQHGRLSPGKGLLIQWLIHCRYPPERDQFRSLQLATAIRHAREAPRPKAGAAEASPVPSLSSNKSKQGDTGRSNQFRSVDRAFRPEGQQLASRHLFSAHPMSNHVTVVLVEDRCCTHIHLPLRSVY